MDAQALTEYLNIGRDILDETGLSWAQLGGALGRARGQDRAVTPDDVLAVAAIRLALTNTLAEPTAAPEPEPDSGPAEPPGWEDDYVDARDPDLPPGMP